jgi:hypothetical protein
MRDFFLPLAASLSIFATVEYNNLSFWERIAEKWGIGFVGLALLVLLAKWTANREAFLQKQRDEKDEAFQEERTRLLNVNNELQAELLKTMIRHASRAEQLTKDGLRASNDHASVLRMLVRKMKRPCIEPITDKDLINHE